MLADNFDFTNSRRVVILAVCDRCTRRLFAPYDECEDM